MINFFIPVKRDMTQVACKPFVLSYIRVPDYIDFID